MESSKQWAVVYVSRGLPSRVELFADNNRAWERVRQIRPGMPQEDELDVLELDTSEGVPTYS